jgi:hypothetical protein
MLHNIETVSNEVRRENKYWIERRNKWRARYDALAYEIRKSKTRYAQMPCLQNAIILSSLQTMATIHMIERQEIADNLKLTSYKYV